MDDSRTTERVAAHWLARRDEEGWSAQDEAALQAWLAERTAHRVAFLRLHAAWAEAARLRALAAGQPADAVPGRGSWPAWGGGGRTAARQAARGVAVPEHAPGPLAPASVARRSAPDLAALAFAPRPRSPAVPRWRAGVAMASVLAIAGGLGWSAWQLGGRDQSSHASALGQVLEVALADGSRATLSSDSRLEVRMDRGERHVSITRGEAFFEVAHDARRPFVVEADGHRAVAVGTRYAVRRDADTLRVVVTEGRVRLESAPEPDGTARPVALLPAGSVATAGRNGVLVRSLPLEEVRRYTDWREGFLAFDDVSLAQAAGEFNRFNARRLELADPALAELRIGGNFRWANLDGFVGLLEQGFPVRAERHPDRIVLHAR